ncbi:MAG TPA: DUF6782 family putative metallopeptidase, partial [Chloroflexota bacterium]
MRRAAPRWLALLALLAALIAPTGAAAAPADAADAPGCQFVMGFAAIRELIGADKVGDCAENEHHNPANGDALQKTSGGLLVWRKADNFTAFTDGFWTWVNGPRGLQRRLNSERFDWEGGGAPAGAGPSGGPAPAEASACAGGSAVQVVVERQAPAPEGAVEVSGTVTNRCAEPIDAIVDVVARSPTSRPISDAPSAVVIGIESGGSRAFTIRVPAAGGAPAFTADVFPVPARLKGAICVEVGAAKCLTVDRRLYGAVSALLLLEPARALVRTAAEDGVVVGMADLPRSARGAYSARRRVIVIAESLMDSTAWVRAAVLVHELQHAADHRAGLLPTRVPEECVRSEEIAFRRTAQFWTWLWGDRLPPASDDMHQTINQL